MLVIRHSQIFRKDFSFFIVFEENWKRFLVLSKLKHFCHNAYLHTLFFFAFPFNAKSFAIAFLVFFHFCFSSLFLNVLPKAFQSTFYHKPSRKRVTKIDSILRHTKKSFRKNCSSSCCFS